MEEELFLLEIYKEVKMEKNFQKPSKRKFPTLATILLVLGIVWFLNDLKVLAVNVPWVPLAIIIIALGIIINRYNN